MSNFKDYGHITQEARGHVCLCCLNLFTMHGHRHSSHLICSFCFLFWGIVFRVLSPMFLSILKYDCAIKVYIILKLQIMYPCSVFITFYIYKWQGSMGKRKLKCSSTNWKIILISFICIKIIANLDTVYTWIYYQFYSTWKLIYYQNYKDSCGTHRSPSSKDMLCNLLLPLLSSVLITRTCYNVNFTCNFYKLC